MSIEKAKEPEIEVIKDGYKVDGEVGRFHFFISTRIDWLIKTALLEIPLPIFSQRLRPKNGIEPLDLKILP